MQLCSPLDTVRGLALLAVFFLVVLGCSSHRGPKLSEAEQLAEEFVSAQPTANTRRGWKRDIYPTSDTYSQMSHRAEVLGRHLRGAAFVRHGVHPYSAYSFLSSGDQVTVIETSMYWGSVRGKWQTAVSKTEFETFVGSAIAGLECTESRNPVVTLGGSSFIVESSSGFFTACTADWFSEEDAMFSTLLNALVDSASSSYAAR